MKRWLDWFATWARKPVLTNGEAVLFSAGWVIAGTVSLLLGWHKIWEVVPLVIVITCIAAFGRGFMTGFLRAMHRELHDKGQP